MPTIFRKAERAELDTILEWAAAEGWNPGLDDAAPFWAADPEGYWIAEEEGTIAAAVSLVRYGDTHAFLGLYIAEPAFRGRGIAFDLWQRALASEPGRTIGLDGVVAQQAAYLRSGFAYAHANHRYGGMVEAGEPTGEGIVEVAPVHMQLLTAYDHRFNPAPRDVFLREWLKDTRTRRSFALIDGGDVSGFGTIRASHDGFKIGPLFSDSETGADLLFRKLVASVGGGQIYLDIPEPNASARALCERYNMTPVFETARMYRGTAPDLPLGQIYGITTFELG
ncbi:GNAT family N-acetyltransferase [Pararhizobium sp.]|uniref:GNAT family N-acetyltransferase n=1 Tax=Pararhizobium sp. TaxID=1977563 RepID=UPI0027234730|nr:GNAT family N-acetyltransferase [Pararhizobium sp.]MDO9417580.1 GNAT family N-acetyltransferase [Pararhizobium sp.]